MKFKIVHHFLLSGFVSLWTISGVNALFAQQPAVADNQVAKSDVPSQPKITNTETVIVTAIGEYRAEQSIEYNTLIEAAPGTSPILAVSKLPSVNFTSADPYGSYEWGSHISVRGFSQSQLGFTLDEVPLGDMSYGNWNGLHVSRAIIDENIGRAVISQGTGALETASTSDLGGTLQFYSLDPSDKRSFTASQSFGSFNAYRTLGRYESGLLPGRVKFYIVGVGQFTDKWKGHGDIGQNYWQINDKLVKYIGSKGIFSVFLNYSHRREVDYQDLNKVWVQKLGYNWDNYGDWAQSIQAANACNGIGSYPDAVSQLATNEDPCDAGYFAGAGLRRDLLGGTSYKVALTPRLTWKTTGYGHRNDGRGFWFTPYKASPNGSPISLRVAEFGITRGGALTSLSYETPTNRLEGGVWFEGDVFDEARRFFATTLTSPSHELTHFPTNPFATAWAFAFTTKAYQIHLQDAWKVTPTITLSAGFKTVETNTNSVVAPYLDNSSGSLAAGSLGSGKPFLPQLGANWKVNSHSEFFADGANNVRSFVPSGPGQPVPSPWATTQAIFNSFKNTLKPESSWSEEVGYRYNAPKLVIQANYFHANFSNRLLAFTQGAAIQGNAAILSNVGGVTTNGVDAALTVQLGAGVSLYNGATWNKSTYDDNVVASTGVIAYATQGKVIVDAPKGLDKAELAWHKKEFFASVSTDYMSQRYFTYSNDGSVDGRFLENFAVGYEREQWGEAKNLKVKFNVYNLANNKYYSAVGTNGFIFSDPLSVNNNTLQVGSPRTISGQVSLRF
jgi:iron complex outermembrane receptor protein